MQCQLERLAANFISRGPTIPPATQANAKWNRKFPEFPNFQKKEQSREVNRNFRNEFPEISVPFDFEPEFREILVEWNALLWTLVSSSMCRNVPRSPCGNDRRHLGLNESPTNAPRKFWSNGTHSYEHLCPLQCAEMYPEVLAGMIAAILVWTNPLLMPHEKWKNARIPHILGTQRAANMVIIKPHISRGGVRDLLWLVHCVGEIPRLWRDICILPCIHHACQLSRQSKCTDRSTNRQPIKTIKGNI